MENKQSEFELECMIINFELAVKMWKKVTKPSRLAFSSCHTDVSSYQLLTKVRKAIVLHFLLQSPNIHVLLGLLLQVHILMLVLLRWLLRPIHT